MADLTFDGTDIREATAPTAGGLFFDIVAGFRGIAEVRGSDRILPGKAGRTARSRVKDRRVIRLHGYIHGGPTSGSLVTRQQDFLANVVVAQALFDPDDAAKDLVATDPYMGLSAAATSTISARVLNVIEGREQMGVYQEWDVVLEAVGDPPDWA